MPLNDEMLGILEKMIDDAVKIEISKLLNLLRKTGINQELILKDTNDFVLGVIFGHVFGKIHEASLMQAGEILSDEQMFDVLKILLRRSGELRNAIFEMLIYNSTKELDYVD